MVVCKPGSAYQQIMKLTDIELLWYLKLVKWCIRSNWFKQVGKWFFWKSQIPISSSKSEIKLNVRLKEGLPWNMTQLRKETEHRIAFLTLNGLIRLFKEMTANHVFNLFYGLITIIYEMIERKEPHCGVTVVLSILANIPTFVRIGLFLHLYRSSQNILHLIRTLSNP